MGKRRSAQRMGPAPCLGSRLNLESVPLAWPGLWVSKVTRALSLLAPLAAVAALPVPLWVCGCSGSGVGVCGNGIVERGEACDCGEDPENVPEDCFRTNGAQNSSCSDSCELREVHFTRVILKWTINGESFLIPGQSFDTCNDVGGVYVRVLLEGPGGYSEERPQAYCTSYQVEFMEDPLAAPMLPGAYNAWLEIQTAEATPLAPLVQVELQVVEGVDNEATADFPLESFYDYENMRGQFSVRAYWGDDGVGCGDATPPVVDRVFTVTQDGSPLAGYPQEAPCEDESVFFSDLSPGSYQVRVEGYDAGAELQFCEELDVKAGAESQPTYYLVIPPLALSERCAP